MRNLLTIILLVISIWWEPAGMAQPPAAAPPSAEILKVGVVDVESGKRAVVEDETVDLVGTARNYRGLSFAALVHPRGQNRYLVAAVSAAEPGNLFTLAGVRFPARDCELMVAIFPASAMTAGTWISDERVSQALAVSERVPITALRPVSVIEQAAPESSGGAGVAITSIGNQSVSPTESVVVPASADVTARAQLLSPGSRIYLSVRVPYTNKCILQRASKGSDPGTYIFRDVLFEAPGDPLVVHFNLMAFATQLTFPDGLLACDTLPQEQLVTSSTVGVSTDRKRGRIDLERVPFIAITRVGRQEVDRTALSFAPVATRQGDPIELGASERVPQGSVLTIWTRERGSHLWLVSPPLVPRGSSTQDSDGDAVVTWVLPTARFSSPDTSGQGTAEYEVMAVLSTTMFPNTWLDSSALSTHSIETVSAIVPVRLTDPDPPFDFSLTVESACGQEVSESQVAQARTGCAVVVESRGVVPPYLRVIVAGHRSGDDSWTMVQAIRNGRTFTVPDFPLTGSEPNARWQLVALASPGALPAATMRYADFLPHLPQTSALALVARNPSGGDPSAPPPTSLATAGLNSWSVPSMFHSFLFLVVLTALLMLIEWQFGAVSEVAGWTAAKLDRETSRFSEQLEVPSKINVGPSLLGLGILAFLSWLIATQYLRLYTEVVGTVTNLDIRDSRGWATYLVVMTGLAGMLIEISHRIADARSDSGKVGLFHAINAVLFFGSFVLWLFSAGLYFEFLRRTSGGLVPPLGAIAAFLVAIVETLGFFFGTHLTLDALGWLVVRVLLLPVHILVMVLGLLQQVFRRRRRIVPPTSSQPIPPPTETIFGAAAGD